MRIRLSVVALAVLTSNERYVVFNMQSMDQHWFIMSLFSAESSLLTRSPKITTDNCTCRRQL